MDFLKQAGADFIKPYEIPRDLYSAALAEVRRIGVLFGGRLSDIAMRHWPRD